MWPLSLFLLLLVARCSSVVGRRFALRGDARNGFQAEEAVRLWHLFVFLEACSGVANHNKQRRRQFDKNEVGCTIELYIHYKHRGESIVMRIHHSDWSPVWALWQVFRIIDFRRSRGEEVHSAFAWCLLMYDGLMF